MIGQVVQILRILTALASPIAAGVCGIAVLWHMTGLLRRFERQTPARFGQVLLLSLALTVGLVVLSGALGLVLSRTTAGTTAAAWPATLPTTASATLSVSRPQATAPAGVSIPAPPRLLGLVGAVGGCSACLFFCTAIAGYVFLILMTRAFARAREAAAATFALVSARTISGTAIADRAE